MMHQLTRLTSRVEKRTDRRLSRASFRNASRATPVMPLNLTSPFKVIYELSARESRYALALLLLAKLLGRNSQRLPRRIELPCCTAVSTPLSIGQEAV